MLCTATADISSSSENINSTVRVSRLSFRFLWLWSIYIYLSIYLSIYPYSGYQLLHIFTQQNSLARRSTIPQNKNNIYNNIYKLQTFEVWILASSNQGMEHLFTLEALYIREIKPELNTKDEYRSRELTIMF